MRRLPGLLAAVLVIAACTGEVGGGAATTTPMMTSTTDLPSSMSSSVVSSTTSPPGPPVAWLAPNGIPLAVTGVDGETVEVLTPCGAPARLTEGTPVYRVDVVIDPGHGGPVDTGAVAATGLAEKEINLRVGLAVHEILSQRGIPTMLTRVGDYAIPIRTRAEYADVVGAKALVSIHHNSPAASASTVPGVEIFVQQDSDQSKRLGGLLFESTMEALGQFDIDWVRASDAGVMTVLNPEGLDAYGMVRLPEAPSVLIELGYIANRAEAELFEDPAYVAAAASSVADAIEAYLTTDNPGSGLVGGRVFRPGRGVGADQCSEPDLELGLYPDVIGADVTREGDTYTFSVTVSSPYDSSERYADAWRIVGDHGEVYAVNELAHHHANEQPFTRSLAGIEIPEGVVSVMVEARDLVYGWGGGTVDVEIP